jgi:uracil-DNA glycosylase family 4
MIEALILSKEFGADEAIEDNSINRYQKQNDKVQPTISSQKITSPTNATSRTRKLASECTNLDQLRKAVESFDGISITQTATNTVFADGQADAQIMLIGEAPGAEEDAQAIPFCGASGQMLDSMLAYIGLSRKKNIYITNTLFWRPPGNRRPTAEELAICLPFVEKHIALIKPKIIILVGSTAVAALIDSKKAITQLRGHYFDYQNEYIDSPIKTTAIFHPSYLLRSPGQKQHAWQDCLKIHQYLKDNNIQM